MQYGDTGMREGGGVTCHHASVMLPGVSRGSLGPLVTLLGCKQLVTTASAMFLSMDTCMVCAGIKMVQH